MLISSYDSPTRFDRVLNTCLHISIVVQFYLAYSIFKFIISMTFYMLLQGILLRYVPGIILIAYDNGAEKTQALPSKQLQSFEQAESYSIHILIILLYYYFLK